MVWSVQFYNFLEVSRIGNTIPTGTPKETLDSYNLKWNPHTGEIKAAICIKYLPIKMNIAPEGGDWDEKRHDSKIT